MGLFDHFRDRGDRESALTAAQQDAIDNAMQQAQMGQAQAQDLGLNGWQGLGALISQVHAAQQAGLDIDTSQVFDMRGSGLREEIMDVIAAHGIDPTKDGQEIDASTTPALQADIIAVLANAGLDLSGAGIPIQPEPATASAPEPPMDPNVPQIRNPLDR